jgi:hypothetical protein
LSVIASLIAIGGVAFGLYKALTAGGGTASASSEAKQIVGFHQVTNRMCDENLRALGRAVPEAHSEVQLLAFLSRGVGWGVNDLESVTAPVSVTETFAEEIHLRSEVEDALLEEQRAGETGDRSRKSEAVGLITTVEESAVRLDHEMGLRQCGAILPREVRRAIGVG